MPTRSLQIRDALVSSIRALPVAGVSSDRVFVNLRQAVSAAHRPSIVLEMGDEAAPDKNYNTRARSLEITLRIIADGADPFAVIDPIRMALHALVMADKTLGGVCDNIIEQDSRRERVDLDVQVGALLTTYQVTYTTTGESLA